MNQLDLFGNDLSRGDGTIRIPSLSDAIHFSVVTIGSTGDGRARINIENKMLLAAAGFIPGTFAQPIRGDGFIFMARRALPTEDAIKIAPKTYTNRDGSVSVGGRLDLRRNEIRSIFDGVERLLAAYCPDGILVTPLPTELNSRVRWRRLIEAAHRGTLTTGSGYTGLGTLDAAAHEGLGQAGFQTDPLFANDVWQAALEAMLADNPARPRTAYAIGIDQLLALETETSVPDILIAGIPCTGASQLNVLTRDNPESHMAAGHQAMNFIALLQRMKFRPAIILIENVVQWSRTMSCSMIRRVLEEQGYHTMLVGESKDGEYIGLLGSDYGDMERRRRMALIACPPELASRLDFSKMRKCCALQTVGDLRDPETAIPQTAYTANCPSMDRKVARGFRNRIVEDSARTTPVISAHPSKGRVEDAKFRHPSDPSLWRLPTPAEHARLKGQPESLVRSFQHDLTAHKALGNGTTRKVWVELFRILGEAVAALREPVLA